MPTVVNIPTSAHLRGRDLTDNLGGDDLLRRFFGGQLPPQGQGQGQGRNPRGRQLPRDEDDGPVTQGTGTGFIIDKSGLILTNNHVVEDAEDIRVSLFGGGRTESYAAKVVGRDTLTDSALIQLTEMPATPLAGSQVRRLGADAAGRLGRGDRQSVRSEPHRDGRRHLGAQPATRRRQRQAAEHAADRRGDQSRELGRAAAERPRRGRRDEYRDLHRRRAVGEHRHRVRDADQRAFAICSRSFASARSRAASSASKSPSIRSRSRSRRASACRTRTERSSAKCDRADQRPRPASSPVTSSWTSTDVP